MRIAILGIDSAAGGELAGATLAARQLDLAIALGAERVIALGHGADPAAIDLRARAEEAGLGFQCVPAAPRRLLGLVGAADDILVMAPGLLVGARTDPSLQSLGKGRGVLTFPAEAGISAGFERIDAETAWGGVLVAPGQVVERLEPLPDDADVVSALLRGARQAGVRTMPAKPGLLHSGDWRLFASNRQIDEYAPQFVRQAGGNGSVAPTRWLAAMAARSAAGRLVALPDYVLPLLLAAFVAGAVALGFYRETGWGFACLAIAAFLHHLRASRGRIARKGLSNLLKPSRFGFLGLMAVDIAFVAVAALSSLGPLGPRIFLPLALILSLRALLRLPGPLPAIMRDRGLVMCGAAITAAFSQFSPFAMIWIVLALLVLAFWHQGERG